MKNNNKYLKNIEILDLGTCGLDILSFLENTDYVIFIDAIISNNKVGSIMKISGEEIMKNNVYSSLFSLHDLGLKEVLLIGKEIQKMPSMLVYGITIESKNNKNDSDNNNIIDFTLSIQKEL